jgi:hypothetical protein
MPMVSTDHSSSGNMAALADRGTRRMGMRDGMGLSATAEKARYRELLCRTDLAQISAVASDVSELSVRFSKRSRCKKRHTDCPNLQLPSTTMRFWSGFPMWQITSAHDWGQVLLFEGKSCSHFGSPAGLVNPFACL